MSEHLSRALHRVQQAKLERRELLRMMGLTAAASAGLPTITQFARAQDLQPASQVIAGKSDAMIVHNDRTGVLETPLDLLSEHAITPKEILYVRNNQIQEPEGRSLEGVPLEGWTIELMGSVAFPRVVDAATLADLPQEEVTMVLQCSGNGRSFYARSVQTRGTQWAHGGMGQVTFRGPKLTSLLDTFEPALAPRDEVNFVTAEGRDAPPEGSARPDFEHSLPLDDVMERAILATHMNGEPLPGAHGGPVRLVVPGYYGTMNVKWLSRLRFEGLQTNNVNQIPRYRIPNDPIEPGTPITYTFDNSTPDWRQLVKSVIFSPSNESDVAAGEVEVSGVAWNDGTVPVTAVEISIDDGQTWRRADLSAPHGGYGWYEFSTVVNLGSGQNRIWSRAIDERGRAQPLNGSILWNPSGYEWHGADYVDVAAS
ncbi:MAG: molybdopterin-dependent oxidoreductase [Trueperaceae bacterium]|nr:molybdopterin-dependent oxidoreductase [Trueperaceae bacterium]